MTYTLNQARKLLTTAELAVFNSSRPQPLRELSAARLRSKVTRTRSLRDKYRDLYQRQTVATREGPAARRSPVGADNARTQQKADLFTEVLARYEARLQRVEDDAKKAETKKAADRKKAEDRKVAAKKAAEKLKAAGKKGAARKAAAGQKVAGKKAAGQKAAEEEKAVGEKAVGEKTAARKTPEKKAEGRKAGSRRKPAATAAASVTAAASAAAASTSSAASIASVPSVPTAGDGDQPGASTSPPTSPTTRRASRTPRKAGGKPARKAAKSISLQDAVVDALEKKKTGGRAAKKAAVSKRSPKAPATRQATRRQAETAPVDIVAEAKVQNPLRQKPINQTIQAHQRSQGRRVQGRRDSR